MHYSSVYNCTEGTDILYEDLHVFLQIARALTPEIFMGTCFPKKAVEWWFQNSRLRPSSSSSGGRGCYFTGWTKRYMSHIYHYFSHICVCCCGN